MNDKLREIYDWLIKFKMKHGENPDIIPISKEHLQILKENITYLTPTIEVPQRNMVFNIEEFQSPYSVQIRTRQLEMPLCRLSEEVTLPDHLFELDKKSLAYDLKMRLTYYCTCSDTSLKLKFEWDIWAWFKRWWNKYFKHKLKVKEKEIIIDGRVLYPYLNIPLSFNKHFVKFYLRP